MSSLRPAGRRFFNAYDNGFSRLSRIDEEQLDRVSINNCKSDPSSTTTSPECSSTLSTPLPPFPSPPVLPPMIDSSSIKLVTTPPLPPPPQEDQYATPPSLTTAKSTRYVDVDAAIYSRVGEHRRPMMTSSADGDVARSLPGEETGKGVVKDPAAAAMFIKEKYDSLGRLQIDRTIASSAEWQDSNDSSALFVGTGMRPLPVAAALGDSGVSPYQVPTSGVCCRSSSSCCAASRTSAQCCGDKSSSSSGLKDAVECQQTHECRTQPDLRRQTSMPAATPFQHNQHHHSHNQQQQQQQQLLLQHHQQLQRNLQNRSQQRQCPHQAAHQSIVSAHKYVISEVAVEIVDNKAAFSTSRCQPRRSDGGGEQVSPMHAQQDRHASGCCRHQHHEGRDEPLGVSTSPQRAVQQTQRQSRSSTTSSNFDVNVNASDVAAGSLDVENSPVLTEHEQTQIEMFYRSHKTLVHSCSTTVRLAFSSADNTVDRELEKAAAASAVAPPRSNVKDSGGAAVAVLSLPTSIFFDERNWSPSSVSGVPVAVLDSGSGRRHRCLSVVLAERGTGFEVWRTTVKCLTFDYYQSGRRLVVDDGIFEASDAADFHHRHHHHIVRVRSDSNDGPVPRWARLSFEDSTSADEFAKHLVKFVAESVGLDEETKNNESDRCRSAPVKKKSGSVKKSDISQPCCFSHVTRIERMDGPAVASSSPGLRGILRGGFSVAMRGLAAVVSGNDSAAPNMITEGTSICRR